MTEIVPDGDRKRLAEITEYLSGELAARGPGETGGIHVHYHAAPVVLPDPPAAQTRGEVVLINAAPYFILLLGGVIVLACVGTVAVILVPALLALAVTCAIVLGSFTVFAIAVAAMVRSLRSTKTERQVSASLLKKKGRR